MDTVHIKGYGARRVSGRVGRMLECSAAVTTFSQRALQRLIGQNLVIRATPLLTYGARSAARPASAAAPPRRGRARLPPCPPPRGAYPRWRSADGWLGGRWLKVASWVRIQYPRLQARTVHGLRQCRPAAVSSIGSPRALPPEGCRAAVSCRQATGGARAGTAVHEPSRRERPGRPARSAGPGSAAAWPGRRGQEVRGVL